MPPALSLPQTPSWAPSNKRRTGSFRDNKIVRAARDDAASFVASEGAVRGVRLESAFEYIRQQAPQLQATDTQLAQAILTI